MKHLAIVVPLVVLVLFALQLHVTADIIVNETFSHTNGNLAGKMPVPGPGSAWVGSNEIQVVNGSMLLDQGLHRESIAQEFGSVLDTYYVRFDFHLPSAQTVNPDSRGLYFANFEINDTNASGRLGVLSPATTGDFGLAVNACCSDLGDGAIWAEDLFFDTTYRVVYSYSQAGDIKESRLWLNPVDINSPSILHQNGGTAGAIITGFRFNELDDYTGSQIIDNLVIADDFQQASSGVPEPTSTIVLLGVTVAVVLRRNKD